MRIYHYTSIQTLALILKYKKIRFNRLDRVDDMEESIYGSGPLQTKLGMYTFVSCWTKNDKENLALWNMYTRYRGVRIGIDEMPFETYKVSDSFISLLPDSISFGTDFFVSSFNNEAKLYDIEYVDNPEAEIEKLIIHARNGGIAVDTNHIGTFKRKEWAMQQESRFKITVFPVDIAGAIKEIIEKPQGQNIDFYNYILNSLEPCLSKNIPINTPSIDLELDTDKLANIEIMMGPLTSDADRIIVESLLNPFPNAQIYNSRFWGKLREK